MRILVVEDEKDLNAVVTKRLTAEGFSVDSCFDGEEALDYVMMAEYDAIVLDIMLPKLDGLEVLRRLRRAGNPTPTMLLTAMDSVSDRVAGLNSGADDYLIKPFSLDELVARVRTITRRQSNEKTNVLKIDDLTMDCNNHSVKRGDRVIRLSSKEFAILEYMLINKNTALTRERIESHIWNYDYEGGSNVIDVYISYLRKKIDGEGEKKLIHTIRGVGYILKE